MGGTTLANMPYADPAKLPEREREIVAGLPPLNIFRMLAHAPAPLGAWLRLGNRILTGMNLPADLREIAILAIARATGSVYEWTQHVVIGRACGMTEAQIAALEADRADDPSLGEAGRLAVRAAREAARDHQVSTETLNALRHLIGDEQTVEMIHTIGFYTSVAIFLKTTGVDVDQVDASGWDKMKGRREQDF
jgi:alkylhydroperoxidase family enzyme